MIFIGITIIQLQYVLYIKRWIQILTLILFSATLGSEVTRQTETEGHSSEYESEVTEESSSESEEETTTTETEYETPRGQS